MASDAVIATLVLGGMCLAMWWLARLARRRMGVGAGTVSSNGLRVVGKRPLDQKNALYVVEIAGGRHILVGASVEGGGIAKVDDITPEEYAAMTDDAPSAPAEQRPALRVASSDAAGEGASAAGSTGDDADDEQRFATVSESFQMLLGRARDARRTRRNGTE